MRLMARGLVSLFAIVVTCCTASGARAHGLEVRANVARVWSDDFFDSGRTPVSYPAALFGLKLGATLWDRGSVGLSMDYTLVQPPAPVFLEPVQVHPTSASIGLYVGARRRMLVTPTGGFVLGVDLTLAWRWVSLPVASGVKGGDVSVWASTATVRAARMSGSFGYGLWLSVRQDLTTETANPKTQWCDSRTFKCLLVADAFHVGGRALLLGAEIFFDISPPRSGANSPSPSVIRPDY